MHHVQNSINHEWQLDRLKNLKYPKAARPSSNHLKAYNKVTDQPVYANDVTVPAPILTGQNGEAVHDLKLYTKWRRALYIKWVKEYDPTYRIENHLESLKFVPVQHFTTAEISMI